MRACRGVLGSNPKSPHLLQKGAPRMPAPWGGGRDGATCTHLTCRHLPCGVGLGETSQRPAPTSPADTCPVGWGWWRLHRDLRPPRLQTPALWYGAGGGFMETCARLAC